MKRKENQNPNDKVIRPILMEESHWANSHLSVAQYLGGVVLNGTAYLVVNKDGKDIFECAKEAKKEGREKAIEPGEPRDLVAEPFIPLYRKMGREKFIRMIAQENELTLNKAKEWMKSHLSDREDV